MATGQYTQSTSATASSTTCLVETLRPTKSKFYPDSKLINLRKKKTKVLLTSVVLYSLTVMLYMHLSSHVSWVLNFSRCTCKLAVAFDELKELVLIDDTKYDVLRFLLRGSAK